MTGDTGGCDTGQLLASGADRVFSKPFDLAEVTRSLRNCAAY